VEATAAGGCVEAEAAGGGGGVKEAGDGLQDSSASRGERTRRR
jgi:hypothetical protein